MGDLSQFIYVCPRGDLVLARHGTDCGVDGISPRMLGDVAAWVAQRL